MSFGFSASEIAQGVFISRKICANIRGSPTEHKDLTLQLSSFRQSLEYFNRVIGDPQLPSSSTEHAKPELLLLDPELAKRYIRRCCQLLEKLDKVNTGHMEKALSREGSYRRRKNAVGEVKWAVYQKDKTMGSVKELRDWIVYLATLLRPYEM
jgi:hypothetical protein